MGNHVVRNIPGRIWARSVLSGLFFFSLVFLSAGRMDYWQGWVYVILSLGAILMTIFVLRRSPDLIQERMSPGQGMKTWDKVYFAVSAPLGFIYIILACLDAGRFGWSGGMPPQVFLLGVFLYILGHGLFIWAKSANAYFSSVVRVQTERGHAVCREGPYAFVRHPGYLGSCFFTIGAPLLLGSYWALIPAGLSLPLLFWRILREEQTLKAELPGYTEYTQDVRFRIIPGIW